MFLNSKLKWTVFILLFLGTQLSYAQKVDELDDDDVIKESTDIDDGKYLDGVVKHTLIQDNRLLPYEPMREADIPWEKRMWRVLDVREKINLPFIYPQRPFFKILIDMSMNGDINVFQDDKFTNIMSEKDIQALLVSVDTTVIFDPDTYEETIKIVRNDINYEDIKRFRLKEIWFFDEESSRMHCRLLGIAPIKDVYSETGELNYSLPLFWIYFPEAREFLSKEQVFNAENDAAPMTWQDLFEARQFSSYIYKVTNPLDLRLKDYIPQEGVDLLLESERIKQKLFNFEHDLWTY